MCPDKPYIYDMQNYAHAVLLSAKLRQFLPRDAHLIQPELDCSDRIGSLSSIGIFQQYAQDVCLFTIAEC
jgi:hypothetical protein